MCGGDIPNSVRLKGPRKLDQNSWKANKQATPSALLPAAKALWRGSTIWVQPLVSKLMPVVTYLFWGEQVTKPVLEAGETANPFQIAVAPHLFILCWLNILSEKDMLVLLWVWVMGPCYGSLLENFSRCNARFHRVVRFYLGLYMHQKIEMKHNQPNCECVCWVVCCVSDPSSHPFSRDPL